MIQDAYLKHPVTSHVCIMKVEGIGFKLNFFTCLGVLACRSFECGVHLEFSREPNENSLLKNQMSKSWWSLDSERV